MKFWNEEGCACPKLDNEDSYPHRRYVSGNCDLHAPRTKLKMFLLALVGILVFPLLFISVAAQGFAYDSAGDYEGGDSLTYNAWQGYKNTFWRKNL
jgi:hypothetical protein